MAKHQRLSRTSLIKAEAHLGNADKVMRNLIAVHGRCSIAKLEFYPFHTLVGSIIGQQLSSKAAATIEARVAKLTSSPFTPASILKVKPEILRSAGLSHAKSKYIQELSSHVENGNLDFDAFSHQENEEIISALTTIPGVGRWTAEMFLIFALKRPNVMALSDAGLRRSMNLLYGEKASFEKLARIWEPYCSVASWYLWQHLDAKPVLKEKK